MKVRFRASLDNPCVSGEEEPTRLGCLSISSLNLAVHGTRLLPYFPLSKEWTVMY